jgi:gluconate 2-dehydrogenase gamma chain
VKKPNPHPSRKLPQTLQDIELWQTNRRSFLKAALLAGTLSQLSFLNSCSSDTPEQGNELLTGEQVAILKAMLMKFFPNDGNGPSAEDLRSYEYVMWTLRDNGANPDDNRYIIDGILWINETSQELYQKNFLDLDPTEQDKAVEELMRKDYGNDWSSILITFIFESLVMDPIYGCNPDGVGWKWLNHTPGYPQASEPLRYENILETVRKSYAFSDQIN